MIGHTLVSRFVPDVFLLVLLEVFHLTSLILGGLVPHLAVGNFIEQQTVVVFAYQIVEIRIQ